MCDVSAYLMLLAPSANHVYAAETATLAAAELAVTSPDLGAAVERRVAGVDYLAFEADDLDPRKIAAQSSVLALFERASAPAELPGRASEQAALFGSEPAADVPTTSPSEVLLRPIELPRSDVLDDDLVTIPKYRGKTNELFTRLLLHVTLSQVTTRRGTAAAGRDAPTGHDQTRRQFDVLDPLAGRGTTLLTAWTAGHNAYGVELDTSAFEQFAGFLKTYLRRKRLKHTAEVTTVRRDGRMMGQRLDATARPGEQTRGHRAVPDAPQLAMTMFTGDTRDAAVLFGKRKFDAIVTDAPYGVVHGATDARRASRENGKRGSAGHPTGHRPGGDRDRSPATLLADAIPVWAGQLRAGGALGLSWNTCGLSREDLAAICTDAGLEVRDDGPWLQFAHRVDSSIKRDLMVAVKPARLVS
ncbi:Putative DNA modification methylase [Propionibacterium freudenreichii]|nr:Putative DNA modification methylase [Propionibacterium freudenreichii]SCQ47506.1 Putative DNA modification methylase [Propionibacterium freudenreichii]SCQ51134.1 Putative DNA modification methylase [Propionibacterium freudenreichii]